MPGVTKIVSARRGGSITATSLRRCLTITSRVRARSSSRLYGLDSTDAAPCLARNWAGVPSSPGATRLTSWYRSDSLFSTGVAVSISR